MVAGLGGRIPATFRLVDWWFVTFEECEVDFNSASRLSLLCVSGSLHGVQWQTGQVEKGRPLRFMRVNGRSSSMLIGIWYEVALLEDEEYHDVYSSWLDGHECKLHKPTSDRQWAFLGYMRIDMMVVIGRGWNLYLCRASMRSVKLPVHRHRKTRKGVRGR